MAGIRREPGSWTYDHVARRVVLAAIARKQAGARRGVQTFIHTPTPKLYSFDRGGRTEPERKFTRAAYHLVSQVPRQKGGTPQWSLKLSWGPVENHGGRWGRTVEARIFHRASGRAYVGKHPAKAYVFRPELRTRPGARIDA